MFVHHKMSLEKSKTHGKGNKNYKSKRGDLPPASCGVERVSRFVSFCTPFLLVKPFLASDLPPESVNMAKNAGSFTTPVP